MVPVLSVYLGGTEGNNKWRESVVRRLVELSFPEEWLYDPAIDTTPDGRILDEIAQKEADVVLYYIGDPQVLGDEIETFGLIQAVQSLNDDPMRTVVVLVTEGLNERDAHELSEGFNFLKQRFPSGHIYNDVHVMIDEVAELMFSQMPKF